MLYTGLTNSLMRRVWQHRKGEISGFTRRYNANRLVYYEQFNDVRNALAREKQIKGWTRRKKEDLIATKNPKCHSHACPSRRSGRPGKMGIQI